MKSVSVTIPRSPLFGEDRVDVIAWRERQQVVDAFADADITDGQLEVVRDRDSDAALRGAIEFRQHDAGDAGDVGELARLGETVLSDRRIEDQEYVVRRARHFPA